MLVGFLAILSLSYWFVGINWVPSIHSLGVMPIKTQKDESHGYLGRTFLTIQVILLFLFRPSFYLQCIDSNLHFFI